MLQVALGIIFILLTLSLFATTIMEIINSVFSLRGKYLKKGIQQMLARNGRTDVLEDFVRSPLYNQLTAKFLGKKRPPSYISPKTFSTILMSVLSKQKENSNTGTIPFSQIKDENLRELLEEIQKEASFGTPDFKKKIEEWYGEVMDRTSGWFKRNNQMLLIFLGLCIAIAFDADTISIFQNLSNNPEAQFKMAQVVDDYFENSQEMIDSTNPHQLSLLSYHNELKGLVNNNIESLREPLGLGWNTATTPKDSYNWLMKFLGWMITALAISLGAPFWFDLLKKVMRIRSSGGVSTTPIIIREPASPPMSASNPRIKMPIAAPLQTGKQADSNTIKSYG